MAQDIVAKIQAAAQARGIDPDVALRIADVESNLRPGAKNPKSSAAGLFQVTDDTWKQYGGKKGMKKNADENIRVGMQILSSNKASLEQMLGREPTGSELYAAHFFGPTGARKVLSADPLTPVSALVSKQAMAANPQLKGKTVNEVMAGFREKFDEGGKRYPTSEPVKTTVVAQAPRTMDQGMEGKAGAAAPALSARDRVADLGTNYQAALAAMMLAEATDEEKEDAAEKVTPYESEAAKNALSGVDLGQTVSPFSAMSPAVQPEGMPFPMRFAAGGFVPSASYSPTVKKELADFNQQWGDYQTNYDTWKKDQYDPYVAAYEKYKAEVYDPYQTAYGTYQSDYDKYAKAVEEWNAGARTSDYAGPSEPAAPTLASEFTMAAPTGNPLPPGLTQEAYAGMDQAALQKYADEQTAAANAKAAQASASQRNRQSALNVAFNPEKFNLSLPDRIASRFMAEGGEVEEYPGIMDVRDYATQASERMFPNEAGQDDRRDAARHMLAAALASKAVGPTAADLLGKAHERFSSPESFFNMLGIGEPRYDYEYDTHNNRIGIKLGERAKSRDELEALVKQMAEQASIRRNPNLPWAMDQEQRDALVEEQNRRMQPKPYADGGDVADPEAALIAGAGDAPPPRVTDSAAALAALRGLGEYPYNLFGGGVDLATMAMRPFGYDVEKPVMGSDWLKEQATRFGIRPPEETDPTLRDIRMGTELVTSMMDPSAGARAVGSVVRGAEELATSEPARVMLERAMQAGGAGPMYAVRPPGGYMLQEPAQIYPDSKLVRTVDSPSSNLDKTMQTAIDKLLQNPTPDTARVDAVSNFLMNQGRQYFSKNYASTNDPIYDALKEGRIKPLLSDETRYRNYMMNAVREGDPEAAEDFAKKYDSGLRAYSASGDPVKSREMEAALYEKAQQTGARAGLLPVEISRTTVFEGPGFAGPRELLEKGVPEVQQAAKYGEPVFDISQWDIPAFMKPESLVDELVNIPPEKLEKMSYPEAVAAVNKNLRFKSDYESALRRVYEGKEVPKQVMLFGTEKAPTKSQNKNLEWYRIADSQATQMEGNAMGHSVGGYSRYGTYNEGGKAAFDEGRALIYSLRDDKGLPTTTVEVVKRTDDAGNTITGITDIRGKFNSRPLADKDLFALFDEVKPDFIRSRSNGERNSIWYYNTDNRNTRLEDPVAVNWQQEYDLYKAGDVEGFAKGGLVERSVYNHQKYL